MREEQYSNKRVLFRMACLVTFAGTYAVLLSVGACTAINRCPSSDICLTAVDLTCDACTLDFQCNDGFETEDADEAFRHCYCTHLDIECVDGRTATLCWPATYNAIVSPLSDTATFSDGEQLRFYSGFAACHGYDACERSLCPSHDQSLFMLKCVRDGDEIYHAWDDKVFVNNYEGSKRYCDGDTFESASKMCQFGLGSCAELDEAECDEARPCRWGYAEEPEVCVQGSLDCSRHDQVDCFADPACAWE